MTISVQAVDKRVDTEQKEGSMENKIADFISHEEFAPKCGMEEEMTGAEYFARFLTQNDVTHAFYCEVILRRAVKEAERLGLRAILAHTENAAGYMADGYARASKKPGVCMAQSIGTANLAAGCMDAWLANVPVVAITGKKPPSFQMRNSYQEGDHRLLFEGVTKFNAEIVNAANAPYMLRQAFREALSGKPGPVHLDITNLMGSEFEMYEIEEPVYKDRCYSEYPPVRSAAAEDSVRIAANKIRESKKPVIVVGRGAVVSGAGSAISELAKNGDIPILTTPDGKTIIDETDSHWCGIVGNYGMPCANDIVAEADLVIYIGCQTSDQTTINWTTPASTTDVIQIDVSGAELGRNYPNTAGLLGDALTVTDQINSATDSIERASWLKSAVSKRDAVLKEYAELADLPSAKIRPEKLCSELAKVLPDDAVIVADTGWSAVWSAIMIRMKSTQDYYRAAGSLGWSFPAALGAKCALPKRSVICFTGDGALYYHLSEMETARKFGINTVTVVNNNNVFGMCLQSIRDLYKEAPDEGADKITFSGTDFHKLAKVFGLYAIKVERADEIRPAMEEALAADRPALVEVITDENASAPPAE
jgi:acetolactate synthase-1/2/3 large subunit